MSTQHDPINILMVDDQPAKLLSYEVILNGLGANLIKANSAREALERLLKHEIAVVLVDVSMPELDGFELAKMLREHPRYEKIAIIFVSAIHLSDVDRIRGYETGAVDYVPVPVIPEILRAKVKIFVELYRKTRQLEKLNDELERRVVERTAALEASTEQLRESEERLRLASEAAGFGTYDYKAAAGQIYWSPYLRRHGRRGPAHGRDRARARSPRATGDGANAHAGLRAEWRPPRDRVQDCAAGWRGALAAG
jgi:response regulator RpfG family c-di-GMP phosphodiesterase